MPSSEDYLGVNASASHYNAMASIMQAMIAGIATATLVKVIKCSNTGTTDAVGTVDIQPLVNLVDRAGNKTPHGTIYRCPYLRMQGGSNAVIIDPQAGDIGVAVFAERDVSSVIANKDQANPGSQRTHDYADGLYIGGMLNGTPSQYVQFNEQGIKLVSPNDVSLQGVNITIQCQQLNLNATQKVSVTSPTIELNGNTNITGNTAVAGNLTNNDVNVGSTHSHSVPNVRGGPDVRQTLVPQ